MAQTIMLKMGEMVLKGLNRNKFEQKLLSVIKYRLSKLGGFTVKAQQSTVYIDAVSDAQDMQEALEAMKKVFGVVAVMLAERVPKTLEAICDAAAKRKELAGAKTFKIETRRADKGFPMTSLEVSAEVGGAVLDANPHLNVNVHTPEVVIWVEVRETSAFIHAAPESGAGGLPPSTSGKAALLLSGGIDSPVAGWRMARRGAELIAVHFHSYPYTSDQAKEKVLKLASLLESWCGSIRVFIVPFTAIQESMRATAPEDLFTILMRRSMCRIAEKIAINNGCGALITGESLGQVASQTMEAMAVTGAVATLPIFRPLIGMDKDEVVKTARAIGTFETSILPFEDCCTVFTPKHPRTKPQLVQVEKAEEKGTWLALEAEAVSGATIEALA